MNSATFSVIVPAHNEGIAIKSFLSNISQGLPSTAEIIVIFNGCTDGSDDKQDKILDNRFRYLNYPIANKALAIRMGDLVATYFPRFYIDADIVVTGNDLHHLSIQLCESGYELISPKIAIDLTRSSLLARLASTAWSNLPYVKIEAFQYVLGVTKEGRERWGSMPDIRADDTFIASHFPPTTRLIAEDVTITARAPSTFAAFVRVRIRLIHGWSELKKNGYRRHRTQGQTAALFRMIFTPQSIVPVLAYILAISLANVIAILPWSKVYANFHDSGSRDTSRTPT